MPDIERIAASLSGHTKTVLVTCEPNRVQAPIADLLNLCLSELAETRRNNTMFLNETGLAVRTHLTNGGQDG